MSTQTQAQVKALPSPKPSFTPAQTGLLQRKCACGGNPGVDGECAECRKKLLSLQRRAANQAAPSTVPPIVHDVLRSSGQPLDQGTRAFMEPRFGHDFSQVRIYTDARAAESARAVNALAYTVGGNVVFGTGQYEPGTMEGRRLLAHELAHVVQQQNNNTQRIDTPLFFDGRGNTAEREANRFAFSIVKDEHTPVSHQHVSTQLQRLKSDENDPIHQPLIENFRREQGLPPGGIDASGEQVGPSDAEIKYVIGFSSAGSTVATPTTPSAVNRAGTPATPCPTSVRIGTVSPFNHSNLSNSDKLSFRTYLGTVSRMDVGPGPNHSGHCMKEVLQTVRNTCPAAVYTRDGHPTEPCTGNRCLDINRYGSVGDGPTHTMLSDGPTAFIDRHRTFHPTNLLEGTGVNSCTTVCQQRYWCDRTQATTGVFLITRNYQASTYTPSGGSPIHITTGTVTKTTQP